MAAMDTADERSVEEISDAIVAVVRKRLAAKGYSLEEMSTWTDDHDLQPTSRQPLRALNITELVIS